MFCIHHTDPDGWCSAAIVNKYFNSNDQLEKRITFHGMDYDDPLPIDKIEKDETVFIVDFSLNINQWPELLSKTENVVWIDHHESSMNKPNYPHHLKGSRINRVAACELTWKYFFNNEIPRAVELTADYDVWTFKYGLDTRIFFRGVFEFDGYNKPDSEYWKTLLSNDKIASNELVNAILETGTIINKHIDKFNASIVKRSGRLIWFEGYRLYVVNNQNRGSLVFDSIDSKRYDILSVFMFNGDDWSISFYTPHTEIDLIPMITKYGGGGHRNACGCRLDTLPFDFTNLVIEE